MEEPPSGLLAGGEVLLEHLKCDPLVGIGVA
jgi:hypothetical protein